MKRYTLPILAVFCGFVALGFFAARAVADTPVVATSDIGGPYRALFVPVPVLADTAPAVTPADPLTELQALKTAYEALKANQDPSVKMLLWAGMLAAGLKLLLTAFNRLVYKETKSWTRWVAVGAAVPIALLSHYALGNGWFASLIYAGSGPGAIVVHELLAAMTKKPTEATNA